MCGGCGDGMCGRCRAGKLVIGGALVLANAFWGPWKITATSDSLTNWIAFLAALMVVKGVLKFIMPNCPHCKAEAAPSGKKGR